MKLNKRSQTAMNKLLGYLSICLGIGMIICIIVSSIAVTKVSASYRSRIAALSGGYEMQLASNNLTDFVRYYAQSGNIKHYNDYWTEVNTTKTRETAIDKVTKAVDSKKAADLIDNMLELSNSLIPLEEKAMELTKQGKYVEAMNSTLNEEYHEVKNQITTLGTELIIELDAYTLVRIERNMIMLIFSVVFMVLLATLLIIIQFKYVKFVAIQILAPIVKIRDNMVKMSHGDLKSTLDIQPDETEIGVLTGALIDAKKTLGDYVNIITDTLDNLADGNFDLSMNAEFLGDFSPITNALNLIIDRLNEAMGNIREAANQVNSGSEQVSSGAQTLSQGATEQASAVQQLSASIAQIAEQVKTNALNSRDADETANKAAESMIQANGQMKDMLSAMNEINDKASEINKIIKTIDDIAFQTNILALNASVEAARAGAAGKGFAVVADEVRNLAAKSAEAASHTTTLIEAAINAVENGTKIADATAETMLVVVNDVKQTSSLISEITTASEEQSTAVEQINVGVEQISSVVSTNTATAEESAAASEELFSQSQILEREVSKYKLKGQTFTSAPDIERNDYSYTLDTSDKY